MTPAATIAVAVLAVAADLIGQLPSNARWDFSLSEEMVTGEPETAPCLEVVAASQEQFESLAVLLANVRPAPDQTEVVRHDGGLMLCLLSPEWTQPDAELRTRQAARDRIVQDNLLRAAREEQDLL